MKPLKIIIFVENVFGFYRNYSSFSKTARVFVWSRLIAELSFIVASFYFLCGLAEINVVHLIAIQSYSGFVMMLAVYHSKKYKEMITQLEICSRLFPIDNEWKATKLRRLILIGLLVLYCSVNVICNVGYAYSMYNTEYGTEAQLHIFFFSFICCVILAGNIRFIVGFAAVWIIFILISDLLCGIVRSMNERHIKEVTNSSSSYCISLYRYAKLIGKWHTAYEAIEEISNKCNLIFYMQLTVMIPLVVIAYILLLYAGITFTISSRTLEPASFSVSADRRFLLLAHNLRKLHRLSYLARYTVFDILTAESYPLTPLPDEVGGGVITEGPLLLLATWTPKGHGLITVQDYDIYYRPAPRSSTGYRVTDTGYPGTVHNGVPDWLYEEEILDSRIALWMSADGHMVLYATFNDTLVHEQKYPWYGAALDTDDPAKTYPEIRSVRYPKPGTNNPVVTLTVADIADPKHIRTRRLTPPKIIIEEGDYYFTSAQWVSLTEVCVVWLTRTQNLSVVSVCKSPMWFCQEVYRISSGTDSWVESAPAPLWSAGGGALVTLAPIRDGPAGLFRHIVRTEHNAHGPRALPLTHGSFDVVKLLAWDHANQHIYYLGIPEGKPGQQHLYRVSADAPRPGSPQKLPYCVTCNSQPSPSINLEFYGNLASSGDTPWDTDWDEELPATSPSPNKKKKKRHPEGMPQNVPCLYYEAHFSPSSAYFVLECLGPGVPTFSLFKISLPEPRLVLHLENNTAVKERLSSIALPTPRTFSVQLSSGHTARVRLLLPPGLREDEVTKYPLVLKVHGAPGTQLVTEQWVLNWESLAAGAGAVLAAVDARGAGGRGLGAHHTLHKRLGTVELQDQLEVVEYLRDSLHFIDARRVAVFGRAHGGFLAALALASTLNVFHCGIAITPIVRWRYYASAYAERYMGLPNATGNYRGYADADVTKQASALHDKMLLLVHGTADDNVHVQQTMALAKTLADQGSMFRQQIYPDEDHSLAGVKRHMYRTMSSFLDECFRKQVPPETKAGLRNGGNLD